MDSVAQRLVHADVCQCGVSSTTARMCHVPHVDQPSWFWVSQDCVRVVIVPSGDVHLKRRRRGSGHVRSGIWLLGKHVGGKQKLRPQSATDSLFQEKKPKQQTNSSRTIQFAIEERKLGLGRSLSQKPTKNKTWFFMAGMEGASWQGIVPQLVKPSASLYAIG